MELYLLFIPFYFKYLFTFAVIGGVIAYGYFVLSEVYTDCDEWSEFWIGYCIFGSLGVIVACGAFPFIWPIVLSVIGFYLHKKINK